MYNEAEGCVVYPSEIDGLYVEPRHAYTALIMQEKGKDNPQSYTGTTIAINTPFPLVEERIFIGTYKGTEYNVFIYHPGLASLLVVGTQLLVNKVVVHQYIDGDIQLSSSYSELFGNKLDFPYSPLLPKPDYEILLTQDHIDSVMERLDSFLSHHRDSITDAVYREGNEVRVFTYTGSPVFDSWLDVAEPAVTEAAAGEASFEDLDNLL